ncbi:MAG: hypothetical protein ACRD2W_16645, partial [Acidimicrobiales bacterium]
MSDGAEASNRRSVQLFGPAGEDLGVVKLVAAFDIARRLDLDLTQMDAATDPPTYRILDYGKWKYEQSRNRPEQSGAVRG